MSTVHEVVTARHSGMKVIGFSLITNICEVECDDDDDGNVSDVDCDENAVGSDLNGAKIDLIVEEVKSVIEVKGNVLKQFVAALVQKIENQI